MFMGLSAELMKQKRLKQRFFAGTHKPFVTVYCRKKGQLGLGIRKRSTMMEIIFLLYVV